MARMIPVDPLGVQTKHIVKIVGTDEDFFEK